MPPSTFPPSSPKLHPISLPSHISLPNHSSQNYTQAQRRACIALYAFHGPKACVPSIHPSIHQSIQYSKTSILPVNTSTHKRTPSNLPPISPPPPNQLAFGSNLFAVTVVCGPFPFVATATPFPIAFPLFSLNSTPSTFPANALIPSSAVTNLCGSGLVAGTKSPSCSSWAGVVGTVGASSWDFVGTRVFGLAAAAGSWFKL